MFPFNKGKRQKVQIDEINTSKNTDTGTCSEGAVSNEEQQVQESSETAVLTDGGTDLVNDQHLEKSAAPCEEVSGNGDEQCTKGKFVIKAKTEGSAPLLEDIDYGKLLELYPYLQEAAPEELTRSTLIFTPVSSMTIAEHISWGKNTGDNKFEQCGIIIGRAYRIGKEVVVGVAEAALPADTSSANPAYLKMDTGAWAKMLDIYDEKYKDDGALVLGWYHTHPNSLSVFMSSTDQATQRAFFNQDWHFAAVLNPQKRKIGCFISADSTPCSCLSKKFM